MAEITVLPGVHVSPETAFVVADYPYGFRLRCSIRYWLEVHPKHGVRCMSQTTNPKRGGVWNKPKASTYSRFAGALYLDSDGHVQHAGLHEYMDAAQSVAWRETYGAGVPEASRDNMDRWLAAKGAYEAARKDGDALGVGLASARVAFATKGDTGRAFVTLKAEHVGKASLFAFDRDICEVIGPIQARDVGKRVCLVGDVLQVESDAQRDSRIGGEG
jgi:hypothetical protein